MTSCLLVSHSVEVSTDGRVSATSHKYGIGWSDICVQQTTQLTVLTIPVIKSTLTLRLQCESPVLHLRQSPVHKCNIYCYQLPIEIALLSLDKRKLLIYTCNNQLWSKGQYTDTPSSQALATANYVSCSVIFNMLT